jgi:hypothetical protein
MTTEEPQREAKLGDGRIAETTVNPDGSWTAWNAAGERIEFVDLDDFEVFEALVRYPEPVR